MSDDIRMHDPNWRAMQKYKMKNFKGPKMTMAYGVEIDATPYIGLRPPGADKSFVLHSAKELLLNPKPGHEYIWRLRTDQMTYGLVETQQIRPVTMDEINREDPRSARIFPMPGPKDAEGKTLYSYATMGMLGLFEAPPAFVFENYTLPQDYAMSKLVNASEQFGEDFSREAERLTGRKGEGHIEVRDRVSAGQERRKG